VTDADIHDIRQTSGCGLIPKSGFDSRITFGSNFGGVGGGLRSLIALGIIALCHTGTKFSAAWCAGRPGQACCAGQPGQGIQEENIVSLLSFRHCFAQPVNTRYTG